jgi:glycosyltransferase involved in cell wall biosynthesis
VAIPVRIVIVTDVVGGGGKELAVSRLALALSERGHEVVLVAGRGEPVEPTVPITRVDTLAEPYPTGSPSPVVGAVKRHRPDAVVMAVDWADGIDAVSRVAPVMLSSHVLAPVCPAGSKYWSRPGAVCRVRAGLKCLALNPVMGCTSVRDAFSLTPYRAHKRLALLLSTGAVGVLALSTDMRARFIDQGVSSESIAVLPNLGMRLEEPALARAADEAPASHRDKVVFVGRLTEVKGAHLLPDLIKRLRPSEMAIFGEGYLSGRLAPRLGVALHGRVGQHAVAGALLWARALAFPSLWPEPGGIVGIDAQLVGVPAAAFDVGAARDWPSVNLVPWGDVAPMAGWLREQPAVPSHRDPQEVSAAMARYWDFVARRAEHLIATFVSYGRWPADVASGNAVRDALLHAAIEHA